jgi:Zn-dependent membrane protease YugP
MTGAGTASAILAGEGLSDVRVEEIDDMSGDHYDPSGKRLCLSPAVYHGTSIVSVGVAAHECGHALQHWANYAPLKLRMRIVPATRLASRLLPLAIIGGFFFRMTGLIKLGIACYATLAVFQLVTLPVEFDASRRAMEVLLRRGIVHPGRESAGVAAVLQAAALTYAAALVAALGNLASLLSARRQAESVPGGATRR